MPAIKKTRQHSPLFTELMSKTTAYGEHNDCAVKAIAVVTGLSYEVCHAALAAAGRKNRDGTWQSQSRKAIESLGFKVEYGTSFVKKMIESYPAAHQILKGLTTHHPRRFPKQWANIAPCMIFSKAHVSGFRDGQLHDWAHESAKRVSQIWFVMKA